MCPITLQKKDNHIDLKYCITCVPEHHNTKAACKSDPHSLTPWRHNPCRVLGDSRSRLQPSLSLALLFQLLTPSLSASLKTPFIHLRFGLPTRLLPSGLSKVIFLHLTQLYVYH